MLSTLHQYFNLNAEESLMDAGQESKRHEVVASLYCLLEKLTYDQKLTLLKLLLKNKMVDFLFKLVIDLSDNQRLVLMKQLEQITSKSPGFDRRKHSRKDCLINAKISVSNRILTCFILDISPYGAYVDTDDGIVVGQTTRLMFSSPNTRKRLIITGKVVWAENQGTGIKFNHTNTEQLKLVRAFTDDEQQVYEIKSC